MDLIDIISILSLICGVIILMIQTISTVKMCKDEFVKYVQIKKFINLRIKKINDETELIKIKTEAYKDTQELPLKMCDASNINESDFNTILFWYCKSIVACLEELYPDFKFNVSIKKISNASVYTVMTSDGNLILDTSMQLLNDNTEYSSIVNDGYNYFFVTDLNEFDRKEQKYISSDASWRNKYNTSIVFPIKTRKAEKEVIVGFICVNSPQTLKKKDKNKVIVALIEKTAYNIANIVVNFQLNFL